MGFQSEINKTIALGGAAAALASKAKGKAVSPEGEIETPKAEEGNTNLPKKEPLEKKPYNKPSMSEMSLKRQVYVGPEPKDVNALKDKLLIKQIEQQKALNERMSQLREKRFKKNVLIKI